MRAQACMIPILQHVPVEAEQSKTKPGPGPPRRRTPPAAPEARPGSRSAPAAAALAELGGSVDAEQPAPASVRWNNRGRAAGTGVSLRDTACFLLRAMPSLLPIKKIHHNARSRPGRFYRFVFLCFNLQLVGPTRFQSSFITSSRKTPMTDVIYFVVIYPVSTLLSPCPREVQVSAPQ